jgi:hypothetical protein
VHTESAGLSIGIERKHGPWIDGGEALMQSLHVLQVTLVAESTSRMRCVTVGRGSSHRRKQNQKDE